MKLTINNKLSLQENGIGEKMAKRKRIQNVTNLSIEQLNAIDLLVQGLPDREVAEKTKVSRGTVTKWRLENVFFQAELNKKRKDIWAGAEDKLRALVADAVDVLEKELKNDNLKAAIEVLKSVNLYGNVTAPSGDTDPDVILLRQAEQWAENELAKKPMSLIDSLDSDEKRLELVQHKLIELKANAYG